MPSLKQFKTNSLKIQCNLQTINNIILCNFKLLLNNIDHHRFIFSKLKFILLKLFEIYIERRYLLI